MSKRLVFPLLVILLAAAPVVANAQTYLYFGAGPTFPSGEYGDYAKTG